MVDLNLKDSEQRLTKILIEEFKGENWKSTLEYWMAGRIVELLEREPTLTSAKAREACRKECSELIRRLRTTREESDHNSLWQRINRNLSVLVGKGDHSYWYREPSVQIDLDKRCILKELSDDDLVKRLLAIHDDQHESILLFATDELVDAKDERLEAVDEDSYAEYLRLRQKCLNRPDQSEWKTMLKEAENRKDRLAILCKKIQQLGRQLQLAAKEIERRG